jgi:hypothetical protein
LIYRLEQYYDSMMEEEIFKKIDGYERYSVSNLGNVRNDETNRILKGGKDSSGYLQVDLCKIGKKSNKLIHRLVANAFIENPDNKICVDHINCDKINNCVNNLRWATISENQMNSKKPKTNTSGIKGVYWNKQHNKWCAYIQVNGKQLHLGLFDDIEKAKETRQSAVEQIFKEYAHDSEKRMQNI